MLAVLRPAVSSSLQTEVVHKAILHTEYYYNIPELSLKPHIHSYTVTLWIQVLWYCWRTLTVFVSGLSEGPPLGENDGHHQVLEGGNVEEGGVLIVPDVFMVNRCGHVQAAIEPGPGAVAGTAGKEGSERVN